MNPNNYNFNQAYPTNIKNNYMNMPKDDRFIGGGFAFPFLLGGVTGAAIAPAFYGGFNRPYYNNYYYPYPNGPYQQRPYYYR